METQIIADSANPDDPIDALRASHDRILYQMHIVAALGDEINDGGVNAFVRQHDQWRHFITFMRDEIAVHARDEEEGLFPMIQSHLASPVDLMLFEHRWINQSADRVVDMLTSLLAEGLHADGTHVRQFGILAKEFAHGYQQHIIAENDVLLAASKGLLTAEQKQELSALMRDHRAEQQADTAIG